VKPFDTIGGFEVVKAVTAIETGPLSGYLAGKKRGGRMVCALEDKWAETFGAKHAIACNSATSGLLAAAFAVGLQPGDKFICPAMTMSATAAAPMFTGAEPYFVDVEDETFGLHIKEGFPDDVKAIFSTNLFGHPSQLGTNEWLKGQKLATYLIEDNAQSPFAMAHGRHCGTMGDIGVFSLNIHKPIQCGEGGMIVTDDDALADRLRDFINHGENAGGPIGLNLRMPEVCAAIGLAQLKRGKEIIAGRIEQAQAILSAIGDIPGCRRPVTREGCTHVYYAIPFLIEMRVGNGNSDFNAVSVDHRKTFCAGLRAEGIPIVEGYIEPLYRLPAFKEFARPCPVAEDLQDRRLFYFENCAWDLTKEEIKMVGDAFRRVAEKMNA
jgi:perosamine synthetase